MRKLGAKNIEAGVGCGVGFGHGFGVGMSCYTLMGDNLLYIISVIYMGSTKIIKPKEHGPQAVSIVREDIQYMVQMSFISAYTNYCNLHKYKVQELTHLKLVNVQSSLTYTHNYVYY